MPSLVRVAFADGRYCIGRLYADAELTLEAAGIYPDFDCAQEAVYWRADSGSQSIIQLAAPRDYVEGEPAQDELTCAEAVVFYDKLIGVLNGTPAGEIDLPQANFFIDRSGAREGYWQLAGTQFMAQISAKSGYLQYLEADSLTDLPGVALGLRPVKTMEELDEQAHCEVARHVFATLYGDDAVVDCKVGGMASDGEIASANVLVRMRGGEEYGLNFNGDLVSGCDFFERGPVKNASGENEQPRYFGWLADNYYINTETGETFYQN